jgi:hypothetical protein
MLDMCLSVHNQTHSFHHCMHHVFSCFLDSHGLSPRYLQFEIVASLDHEYTRVQAALQSLSYLSRLSLQVDWKRKITSLEYLSSFAEHLA